MDWIAVIVIVLVVLLIFYLFDVYTSNYSLEMYNQINNDNDLDAATRYISTATSRFKRSPLENYRLGNVYDFMLRDDEKAHEYYLEAINQIIREPSEDALFIQTRLRDRINIDTIFEVDDNKYNLLNLDELDNELRELEMVLLRLYAVPDAPTTPAPNSPITPATLEERVQWKSDSQNVHDSNINNNLRDGYEQIKEENLDKFIWEIDDITDYIKYIYSKEADPSELHNVGPALYMLDYIKNKGAANITKISASEREFVGQVFTKIYNEPDQQKKKNMIENFMLNLKESYGSGSPVCITGRTTRIMTSFSDMDDANPTLGILKAKPVIRNEILMKAADIRNKVYDAASKEIKEKYDKAVIDDETESLENSMKQSIKSMVYADYEKLAKEDARFIQNILDEINASL